jgi:hypothetical protein
MSTFIKINKAAEVDAKLEAQKEVLNQAGHKAAIKNMNEAMASVRREYKVKESKSLSSAAKVVLTS